MPIDELLRQGVIRPIVRWGTPIMHAPTTPVTDFGGPLQRLLADMFATNAAANGAGLAAPQIDVGWAAFIFDCTDEDGYRRVGVLCNPQLQMVEGRDRKLVDYDEGCLSLPGAHMETSRPEYALCKGQDQFGNDVEIHAGGTLGRCLQHETDHLRGQVFGDRLSNRNRKVLYRRHHDVADRYPTDWPVSPIAD